jgi:hypothetical protein
MPSLDDLISRFEPDLLPREATVWSPPQLLA